MKNNYSKIKAESMFCLPTDKSKSKCGWVIVILDANQIHKAPRYVWGIGKFGHKTFRYSTIGYMHKHHKKPDFFADSEFNYLLYIVESMMCNGFQVSLERVFEDSFSDQE
jgi:hypothetical protein